MKKLVVFSLFSILFSSCNTGNQCSNEELDGIETEIDCGGDCDPCPQAGTLFATVTGIPYYANTVWGSPDGNGMDVISNGSGGSSVQFEFVNLQTNTFLPMTGAQVNNNSANIHYYMQFGDTGSVYITAHDELRKIISGRFFFAATGNQGGAISDGTFENVRY